MAKNNASTAQSAFTAWRSLQVLVVIGALVCVSLLLFLRGGSVITKGNEVRVEFPAPGTTLVRVNGQPDKASYLLAASDLWANTGLVLEPSQRVLITASGSANLAIHRLIDAAVHDILPRQGWVGPGTTSKSEPETKDTVRQPLKIAPDSPDGVLLAFLHKQGETKPNKDYPRPNKVIVVGASSLVVNESIEPRTIWLVINDGVLGNNDLARRAYLEIDRDNDPKIHRRPKGFTSYDSQRPESWTPAEHWKYIFKKQYWNLWYDDNVGFYQVQFDFNVGAQSSH